MVSQKENGWDHKQLINYVDAKFQTIEAAAKEAKEIADRTLAETIKSREIFLSKTDYNARHGFLEEKVDGLAKTPWSTYGLVAIIFIAISGGFWGMVNNRFDTLDKRGDLLWTTIKGVAATYVPIKLLDESRNGLDHRLKERDKLYDDGQKAQDRFIDLLNARIERLYIMLDEERKRVDSLKK